MDIFIHVIKGEYLIFRIEIFPIINIKYGRHNSRWQLYFSAILLWYLFFITCKKPSFRIFNIRESFFIFEKIFHL